MFQTDIHQKSFVMGINSLYKLNFRPQFIPETNNTSIILTNSKEGWYMYIKICLIININILVYNGEHFIEHTWKQFLFIPKDNW